MEKEDNYTSASMNEMDYSTMSNTHQQIMMMNNPQFSAAQHDHFSSFGDVMQFADFGPRLALQHQSQAHENEDGGGNYMLKFPVLNDDHHNHEAIMRDDQSHQEINNEPLVQLEFLGASGRSLNQMMMVNSGGGGNSSDQVVMNQNNNNNGKSNSKRKRARTVKTTEEVESQRMTHIAVERNRRKQMNEHLRVLRTLMPSSYVQRGDQASIIGGAIEFVRELEQLLQCLESQKRRRLYGDATSSGGGGGGALPLESNQPFGQNNNTPSNANEDNQVMAPNKQQLVDLDNSMMMANLGGLQEETAESKSSIADVEVKLLGFDAFIKILSRRRPGQLIKAISALQDLQFNILHTNITTIEQTVLYSFNVQISSDTRFSAEDLASSVQQIFTFIHATSTM